MGKTENAQQAKKKAEKVWVDIYGDNVSKEKSPYTVSYDEESETWLVTGSLPRYIVGGVPHIIIQENDGKVLAVWHDK